MHPIEAAGGNSLTRLPLVLAHRSHDEHVGAVLLRPHLKVAVHVLAQHRWRERAEGLAELDLEVHHGLHFGRARVSEDGAASERARPKLHAALHVAHHASAREQLCDLVD